MSRFDDELTGLEHLLLAGRRLGIAPGEARVRAACLLIGLDLGTQAHRPVRTYASELRSRLELAVQLMNDKPGRSNGGTGRAWERVAQAVPSADRPGSARSL